MSLWGSSIDASIAVPWELPEDVVAVPVPVSTITVIESSTSTSTTAATKSLVKPTAHLPEDHGDKEGEAHLPFGEYPTTTTATPTAAPLSTSIISSAHATTTHYADRIPSDVLSEEAGYLAGMTSSLSHKTWLFVAGGTIIVFIGAVTYWLTKRRKGVVDRGGGYDFAPTDEDDVPMSALERERSGQNRARTLDLYDAFALEGDDDSDEEDEKREREASPKIEESERLLSVSSTMLRDVVITILTSPFAQPAQNERTKPFSDAVDAV